MRDEKNAGPGARKGRGVVGYGSPDGEEDDDDGPRRWGSLERSGGSAPPSPPPHHRLAGGGGCGDLDHSGSSADGDRGDFVGSSQPQMEVEMMAVAPGQYRLVDVAIH